MNYSNLSRAFAKVKYLSVREVGNLIGGKVKQNVDGKVFTNACALRLSYAINNAGGTITSRDGAVSSGDDGKKYLYRVSDMINYVKKLSSTKITGKNLSDFSNKKGIIIFGECGWSDATGHVDLFDGMRVEGHDYFDTCGNISLYILN